jgi:hypothetical protein
VRTSRAASGHDVRVFAVEVTRATLGGAVHPELWGRVARATTIEELVGALGYCAGATECARLTLPANSTPWRVADLLANAAHTFAAVLRAPVPVAVDRCVAAFRAELHTYGASEARASRRSVPDWRSTRWSLCPPSDSMVRASGVPLGSSDATLSIAAAEIDAAVTVPSASRAASEHGCCSRCSFRAPPWAQSCASGPRR